MKRQTVISRKKRGPPPTGKGEPIMVRVQPDLLEKLEAWRAYQDDRPSRPEAIRRLVEQALEKKKR
jgi:metal-responsive CopG/Arc/MetJ family transcriptional regulator